MRIHTSPIHPMKAVYIFLSLRTVACKTSSLPCQLSIFYCLNLICCRSACRFDLSCHISIVIKFDVILRHPMTFLFQDTHQATEKLQALIDFKACFQKHNFNQETTTRRFKYIASFFWRLWLSLSIHLDWFYLIQLRKAFLDCPLTNFLL